jgi:hypothetical protein
MGDCQVMEARIDDEDLLVDAMLIITNSFAAEENRQVRLRCRSKMPPNIKYFNQRRSSTQTELQR